MRRTIQKMPSKHTLFVAVAVWQPVLLITAAAAAAAAIGCPIEDMVNESIILFYAVYFTTARVVHIIQQLGANYLWRCFALDYSNYQLVDEKHIGEYFKK